MKPKLFLMLIPLLIIILSCINLGCETEEDISARKPGITINPESVDFGDVPTGVIREKKVEISNTGISILRDIQLLQDPQEKNDNFSLDINSLAQVAPTVKKTFIISYHPKEEKEEKTSILVRSNDTNRPEVKIEVRGKGVKPALTITPNPVDFGKVTIGESKSVGISVENTGNFAVTLKDLRFVKQMDDIAIIRGDDLKGYTLEMGERESIIFEYSPDQGEEDTNTFEIETDIVGDSIFKVLLKGVGVAPKIEIDPARLEFKATKVGQVIEKKFRITNSGNSQLEVDAIKFIGSGNQQEFFLDIPTLPIPIAAGKSSEIKVSYKPLDHIPDQADLDVNSNDPLRRTSMVRLIGDIPHPRIELDTNRADVELRGVLTDTDIEIDITNAGNATLKVEKVEFVQPNSTKACLGFSLVSPTLPKEVEAQKTETFTIHFTGENKGDYDCEVKFHSNDPVTPEVKVTINLKRT